MRKKMLLSLTISLLLICIMLTPVLALGESPAGGNYIELDGIDDYASAPDSVSLDVGDTSSESLTIEAWVYVESWPSSQEGLAVIAEKSGAYALLAGNYLDGSKVKHRFTFWVEGWLLSMVGVKSNRWYHVAGVFDNEKNTLGVFVNGQSFISSESYMKNLPNSSSEFLVSKSTYKDCYFHGRIDELRISDEARYKDDFTQPPKRFICDEHTRALWHFDEAKGQFTDATANHNDLANHITPDEPVVKLISGKLHQDVISKSELLGTPPYKINVPANGKRLEIKLEADNSNDNIDLFVNFSSRITLYPEEDSWLTNADVYSTGESGSESISITSPELDTGDYYIGVVNLESHSVKFTLTATVFPPKEDTIPPAPIKDLQIVDAMTISDSITLQWTSPGDDGMTGTAKSYDIRYSKEEIDTANFKNTAQLKNSPEPEEAGSVVLFTVDGLKSDTCYYFAIKTEDEEHNWSKISNVVKGVPPSSDTVLKIIPENQEVGVSEEVVVEIHVEQINDLSGFQIDLSFDPKILEALKVEEGNFMKTAGQTHWVTPQIDNKKGKIMKAACMILGGERISGSGVLTKITFKTKAQGKSLINFGDYKLANSKGKPIEAVSEHAEILVIPGCPEDINGDGVIDIQDLVLIGKCFGVPGVDGDCKQADVNGDGKIDILDLIYVGNCFGQTCPKCHSASPTKALSVHPLSSETVVCIGKPRRLAPGVVQLDIKANSTDGLYGFQFDLEFESDILKVISVEEGSLLKRDGVKTYFKKPQIDNQDGHILNAAVTRIKANHGIVEDGTLATITLQIEDKTTSAESILELRNMKFIDSNGNLILPKISGRSFSLEQIVLPEQSALLQNYPNPFNPETWIPYQLARPADVTIQIYNVAGQLVRTFSLGQKSAGIYRSRSHAVYWDGRNNSGEKVSSGVYFYRIQAGNFTATQRMVIMK